MSTKITIQKSWHSGHEELNLRFSYDQRVVEKLRTIKGAYWSAAARCWIVPGGKEYVVYLNDLLAEYTLDWHQPPSGREHQQNQLAAHERSIRFRTDAARNFHAWMLQRRYSLSTMKTYSQSIDYFLTLHQQKLPHEITPEEAEQFLRNEIVRKGLSVSYQRQLINALRLFYGSFLRTRFNVELLVLPRKPRTLPKVISQDDVQAIIRAIRNQKHRTALLLLYACGLRRSELLNLQIRDIDSSRCLLLVRQSKGRKDRYVPLPLKLLGVLREYYSVYRPQHYLFEGQSGGGTPWSAKSLEQVLRRAVEKAGIHRRVNLHMFRHSYATHQLEVGVNLRYIQEILGHASPLTTQIYTHVTQDSVRRISSPAERLNIW